MSEPKKRRRGWPVWVGLAIALLLVLYVLSYGPIAWLVVHGRISPSVLDAIFPFYRPLNFATAHCPPFRAAYNWYMQFWFPEWGQTHQSIGAAHFAD